MIPTWPAGLLCYCSQAFYDARTVPDSCLLRKENKFAACKTKSWGKFLILRKINERGEGFGYYIAWNLVYRCHLVLG